MEGKTNQLIFVQTGEVKTGTKGELIKTSAIGSCIAIAAFDLKTHIGGMAHIMLSGYAPENKTSKKNKNLRIMAKSAGGFERRSLTIDLKTGNVTYTIGDGKEKQMYSYY
ncbi:MAG: hypothetical protein U9R19_06640 [Bacteroidota bacterium]|nr:hypothetical protein [Bacteroidota bacterium]